MNIFLCRVFTASGVAPGSVPTGYMDGYNDGGHGSSGPIHYPSSSSPWSQKPLPHGVTKGQVHKVLVQQCTCALCVDVVLGMHAFNVLWLIGLLCVGGELRAP